jgi:hypothetical protein
MTQYAIVRHSGYEYAGNRQFLQGLEMRSVRPAQAEKVLAVGGVVFDSYLEADDFCEAEMYPPTVKGIIPDAPGVFSRVKIDGLSVYIPKVKVQA